MHKIIPNSLTATQFDDSLSTNFAPDPFNIGAALLGAALLLPGMGIAQAETPPEHANLSVRYLNYEENQADFKRVTANSPSISLLTPIGASWSLDATLTSDSVSGASPRYHTAVSGASRMNDDRTAGDVAVTRYFPRGSVTMGTAYSTEHDYESRALSLSGSFASEDKNTSWNMGVSGSNDRINPTNRIVVNETKKTIGLLAGVTQILSPDDIAQFTLNYSHGEGYFSDPYKALDRRPRERNQVSMLVRWNHYFSKSGGTGRFSYRYYKDSYEVKAHTLSAEYVQALSHGWIVAPSVRVYSQSAASFYFDPVYDSTLGAPFPPGYVFSSSAPTSADQRLAGFGALSVGLKLSKQLTRDWMVDVKVEKYEQRGEWRLFHKGSPGLEPLRAQIFQIGLTRQW
ncbi:MAG: DUF3570 domain-containing protein [Burkholderiales bacterium]|nr:DUF3570 domain-containing protein [Burkholderiales bacterium]